MRSYHLTLSLGPNFGSARTVGASPQLDQTYVVGFESGFAVERRFFLNTVGLELGANYLVRGFQLKTVFQEVSATSPGAEIPLQLRLWLGSLLSVGGGMYAATLFGPVEKTIRRPSEAAVTTRTSPAGAGLYSIDFGFIASARVAFPVAPSTRLYAEGRYRHGAVDLAKDPAEKIYLSTVSAVGGLQFEF